MAELKKKPYTKIMGPHENGCFGIFPEIKERGIHYPTAPIFLFHGEDRGDHSGFGLQHIWQQRLLHMPYSDASTFVVDHLKAVFSKSDIHWEGNDHRGNHKANLLALTSKYRVVIQYRHKHDQYSVITWYPKGPTKGKVSRRVGKLEIAY